MNETLDETDAMILGNRWSRFIGHKGPRTGDFVVMQSGNMLRLGNETADHFQVAQKDAIWEQRFYLSYMGTLTYSGKTYTRVLKCDLVPTHTFRRAFCWFYHHDIPCSDGKITASIMARVYNYRPRGGF